MTLTGGLTTADHGACYPTPGGCDNWQLQPFSGGAVRSVSYGSLTIQDSVLTGNSTTGNYTNGGAVFARNSLSLHSSTISHNSTDYNGGGVSADHVTVTESTISGNTTIRLGVFGSGGGIDAGTATVTNSSITRNSTAGGFGGGVSASDVKILQSTISANSAATTGGGISGHSVSVVSSTIVGNTALDWWCFYGICGPGSAGISSNDLTVRHSIVSGNF